MIKCIQVDNFKAFNNVIIPFTPFTALIGDNSSGKTTVLQLIAFLKCCCVSSFASFLSERHISAAELCSKFSAKKTITIKVDMEFESVPYVWTISIIRNQSNFALSSEEVVVNNKTVLTYKASATAFSKSYRWNAVTKTQDAIMAGVFGFSIIQLTDGKKQIDTYPALVKIKSFFQNVEVLDLLSPYNMKNGSQKNSSEIGKTGEKLSAFIKNLSVENRKKLAKDIQDFVSPFDSIDLQTKAYGWTYLQAKEKYKNSVVNISSANMSDGVLRIIAFCSLQFLQKNGGVILLDEIEDGINNEHLELLVNLLRKIQREKNIQIIVTTHSTVLLDFWNEEKESSKNSSIIYMGRTDSGDVVAKNIFCSDSMQEKLDYMYPGEIILNMTNRELQKAISEEETQ